jgi:dolichol-phosphate mannosyltransferase
VAAPRALICIPTYNEADNVTPIIVEVLKNSPPECDILIIDDGSPDGTAEIVEKVQTNFPRVHLLKRTKKDGLAAAYLAGFAWALERDYEWVFEMDADFSHNPRHLHDFFREIKSGNYDAIFGSRYVPGGGISNWSKFRLFISYGGSLYARMILRHPLHDWTGGFNAWSRKVLTGLNLKTIQSKGYSFQIELKYRTLNRNYRTLEIPIIFEERRTGTSKMSGSIFKEGTIGVLKMKIRGYI